MAKRFTDTEKWGDRWFRKLPVKMKVTWMFLCDSCDAAGVWKIDLDAIEFNVGEAVSMEEIEEHFTKRIAILDAERLWITKFIPFQYKDLSPKNNAHRGIMRQVFDLGRSLPLNEEIKELIKAFHAREVAQNHNALLDPQVTLNRPSTEGQPTPQEKEKEKEKEKYSSSVFKNLKIQNFEIQNSSIEPESLPAELPGTLPPNSAAPPPGGRINSNDLRECLEIWGHTLRRHKIAKDAKMDEMDIGRLLTQKNPIAVKLALLGAGYEDSSPGYNATKHVRISRLFKPDIFDLFVNLGGQVKETEKLATERKYSDEV